MNGYVPLHENTAGILGTSLNLMNNIIGAGFLTLPYCLEETDQKISDWVMLFFFLGFGPVTKTADLQQIYLEKPTKMWRIAMAPLVRNLHLAFSWHWWCCWALPMPYRFGAWRNVARWPESKPTWALPKKHLEPDGPSYGSTLKPSHGAVVFPVFLTWFKIGWSPRSRAVAEVLGYVLCRFHLYLLPESWQKCRR